MDKVAQGNQAAALEQRAGQHRVAIMDHGICAASDPQENFCELRVGDPAAPCKDSASRAQLKLQRGSQ